MVSSTCPLAASEAFGNPDFETPASAAASNLYTVIVQAADSDGHAGYAKVPPRERPINNNNRADYKANLSRPSLRIGIITFSSAENSSIRK